MHVYAGIVVGAVTLGTYYNDNYIIIHMIYSQVDIMNFWIGAHHRHLDVTFLVAFDQTVPALVPLFADTPREVPRAHQAVEAAVARTSYFAT